MSNEHKPLTAAEIEGLWELEAKATKGPWAFSPYGDENRCGVGVVMDENDEPIVGLDETEDGIVVEPVAPEVDGYANAALIAAMRNALPRLLSMLQPPTDAAVREAVRYFDDLRGEWSDEQIEEHLDTLLSHIRAAQAPRLKGERLKENAKKAWKECHAMSSELSKANQDRDRWRECAVYLDYRGADYCVTIHKELDGLQADNAEHREQMSRLLKNWKSRATRAEAELAEARGRCERLREVAKTAVDRLVCDASCPARITGAEVDCTCGLVAIYDAIDAALAECGEG